MSISSARFLWLDRVHYQYEGARLYFKYYGFEWVTYPGDTGMYLLIIATLITGLFVTAGLFYRLSSVVLFLSFTYTELIDLTYYLNHYYFISLCSFLMCFLPSNRRLALDVVIWPAIKATHIPRWMPGILKMQMAIVYIYAGLAKLNSEWLLKALPLKIWLPAKSSIPIIGKLFTYKTTAYLFSWMGMIYDTTIVFFLSWKRTVIPAYITVIIFHSLTGVLFQIGMFPVIMILITPIFFPSEWHDKMVERIEKIFKKSALLLPPQ